MYIQKKKQQCSQKKTKKEKEKREHFNRSIDIRYSVVAFNMSLLTVKLQLG